VIAEAQGQHGLVRVEERNGLRLLSIDGVVQGAVPLAGAPLTGDPLVALVRAARPNAKRALVIGLGTGRTAAELAAHGLTVEVVEQEPAVIDFARQHFDYEGHAEPGDGFTRSDARDHDIILVDTLAHDPPQVLADLYDRLQIDRSRDRVLLGVRLRGFPNDPLFLAAARRTRYLQLWVAGAGDEMQTIYALLSPSPANIVAPADIAAWPLPLHFEPHERPTITTIDGQPSARRVALLGYLIRAREDGALCLDLPHQEMGAQRYRLRGPALVQLEPLLPKRFAAMTAGDISLDGDTSGTLREVLGGGGLKRSDVRFSPVVVALTGTARVAAVVEPDNGPFLPPELRSDGATDPRLPHGGALYDLDVETVVWTLDRATWQKLRPQLTGLARKSAAALERGDFTTAAAALGTYLETIDRAFADFAPRFAIHADLRRIQGTLEHTATALPPRALPGLRGQRCADLYDNGAFTGLGHNPDVELMARAAEKCKKRLGPRTPQ
jgi:SAM-dependent methyltransferase